MQMNNMAELVTVQKYWRTWSNRSWIVCVLNNRRCQSGHVGTARDGGRSEVCRFEANTPTLPITSSGS